MATHRALSSTTINLLSPVWLRSELILEKSQKVARSRRQSLALMRQRNNIGIGQLPTRQ
jgi:hypothetical protein